MNLREQKQMRQITFIAIVFSTVGVIPSIITLPLLYGYIQSLESHLMMEVDFCKVNHFI